MPLLLIAVLAVGWGVVFGLADIYGSRPAPEVETVLDPEPENRCESCGIEVDGEWALCEWCDDYEGPEVPS